MNSPGQHPVITSFEALQWVRTSLTQYFQAYPTDSSAQFAHFCAVNFMRSHAQLFQDLMVVFILKGKRDGYFVEFGATNGSDMSNTLILERDFQWKGILAEPAKGWHAALKANRKAAIDTRCVWSKTGTHLEFRETENAEGSTLMEFIDKDSNRDARKTGADYPVETITLNDLLSAHSAPKEIDYMSIDTEGSELPILQAFDFSKHDIKIMTVEHNFVEPNRQQMFDLLTAQGFIRVFEPLSKFDDWYVKRALLGG